MRTAIMMIVVSFFLGIVCTIGIITDWTFKPENDGDTRLHTGVEASASTTQEAPAPTREPAPAPPSEVAVEPTPAHAEPKPINFGQLRVYRNWSEIRVDTEGMADIGEVGRILIGHTVGRDVPREEEMRRLKIVEQARLEKFGWKDIGVHFAVGQDGIYVGRPLEFAGKIPPDELHGGAILISVLGNQALPPLTEHNVLRLLAILLEHFNLSADDVGLLHPHDNVAEWWLREGGQDDGDGGITEEGGREAIEKKLR